MGRIKIYGTLYNDTPENTAAYASQIYDEKAKKTQEEINAGIWGTELFGGIITEEITVLQQSVNENTPACNVFFFRDRFVFAKQEGIVQNYYASSLNSSQYNDENNKAKTRKYFICGKFIFYFSGTELIRLGELIEVIHSFDTSEGAKNQVLDAFVVSSKFQELENKIKELMTADVKQEELILKKYAWNQENQGK